MDEDVANNLIYLWERWGIYKAIGDRDIYGKGIYCDINHDYIIALKLIFANDNANAKVYNWHSVTKSPFFYFQDDRNLTEFDEENFDAEMDSRVTLTDSGEKLLLENLSQRPFLEKTLSSVIIRELFENTIQHAFESKKLKEYCFGIAFNRKKTETFYLEENFKNEALQETSSFFKDLRGFKNQSFIEFTFLDFGRGIFSTLQTEYEKFVSEIHNLEEFTNSHNKQHLHTKVLEYAFYHNSSRHPIDIRYGGDLIPRGLYDLLDIVWQYRGVIIVRSGYGKIVYDFSKPNIKHPKDAIEYFKERQLHLFKGTMVTIYLPENKENSIITTIRKPKSLTNVKINEIPSSQKYYIDVLKLFRKVKKDIKEIHINIEIGEKNNEYNILLGKVDETLERHFKNIENKVIPIDFAGCDFDYHLSKKFLYYLATTHSIPNSNSIIILNVGEKESIRTLQSEIINLNSYRNGFILQPVVCLFDSIDKGEQERIWIGIKNVKEELELNRVLDSKINENNEEGVTINEWAVNKYLSEVIKSNFESSKVDEKTYFLTAGNYYQKEFLSFLKSFQEADLTRKISQHLVNQISKDSFVDFRNEIVRSKKEKPIAVIAITLSSQLLGKETIVKLREEFNNQTFEFIRLSSYNSFFLEKPFLNIEERKVILVIDVIATGSLLKTLEIHLKSKKSKVIGVLAIVDTRTQRIQLTSIDDDKQIECFFDEQDSKIVASLRKINLPKFKIRGFFEDSTNKDYTLERINPITNGLNLNEELHSLDNILFNIDEFLKYIPEPHREYLKIGFIEHNQVYHTYFFETQKFFRSEYGLPLVKDCLEEIAKKRNSKKEVIVDSIDCVLYPIFSGAEFINQPNYKSIFKSGTTFIPASRVNTPKGWRFTNIPDTYSDKKYNAVFIIDDGSCSGETILQLIDEVAVLDAREIIILSIVARIEDFQRDFFSKINRIKNANDKNTPINIYFGVHLHIQVYNNNTFEPFFEEEKHLENLRDTFYFPEVAKEHITRRLTTLYRKDSEDLGDFNYPYYFPKEKKNKEVNTNHLLDWRNKLGCIQSYKFYKSYFEPFDSISKKYIEGGI